MGRNRSCLRIFVSALIPALVCVATVPVVSADALSCAGIDRADAWKTVATPLPARAFTLDAAGRIFVAGEGAIARSDDGGCTWRTSFELGDDPVAADARLTAIAATGSTVVAAATGPHVLVSADGGATWARSDEGLDLPGTPIGLYAAPSGDVVYLLLRQGVTDQALAAAGLAEQGVSALATIVYRSGDGGRSWTRSGNPGLSYSGPHGSDVDGGRAPGAVWDLAIDPADPNHLLAASRDGIFRSVRGGAGWEPAVFEPGIQVRTVAVARPTGGPLLAVAVDPRSGTLYWSGDVASGAWDAAAFPQLRTEQMLGYPNAAPWAWSAFAGSEAFLSGPKGVFRRAGSGLVDAYAPGLGGAAQSVTDLQVAPVAGSPRLWGRALDGSALVSTVYVPPPPPNGRDRIVREAATRAPVAPPPAVSVPAVDPGGVALVPATRRVTLDPGETATVEYEARLKPRPTAVDVYFLLDTTASMSDTIRALTRGMGDIAVRLAGSRVAIRAGVGAFRTYPRESDRAVEDYPYRRIRPLGPVDDDLVRALYEIEGRGSSGSNLAAVIQAVTGAGQDALPPGPSKGDIAPGGEAGFRDDALKVVLHFADTWFGTPERGDPNGNYVPGTWPGPGFDQAAAALTAEGVHHLGVAMQPAAGGTVLTRADVAGDLRVLSRAASSFAGARGADCDGDARPDVPPGAPLVCPLERDGDAGRLAAAVTGLIEALEDRGRVELAERGESGVVRRTTPRSYPNVDLRGSHRLSFEVTVGCDLADAGTTATAHLDLHVADVLEASAPLRVTCNDVIATGVARVAPRAPLVPLLPPIPAPPPPHSVPGTGPGSVTAPAPVQAPAPAQAPGGQPQAVAAAQRQQQPQMAFVAAAQHVRAQTQMQHAMVRTRARDPLGAARTWTAVGALTILWAWGLATAVAASHRRARP